MDLHEQQKKRYYEMANEDANKPSFYTVDTLIRDNALLKKQNEVLEEQNQMLLYALKNVKEIGGFKSDGLIGVIINTAISQCTK